MKDSSSMEERLEQVLDRVIDWLKYEEVKNAALLTLDGVGLGVILQWLSAPSGAKLLRFSKSFASGPPALIASCAFQFLPRATW